MCVCVCVCVRRGSDAADAADAASTTNKLLNPSAGVSFVSYLLSVGLSAVDLRHGGVAGVRQ